MNSLTISLLNWVRGLCAILVVLGHSRSLGWAHGVPEKLPDVGILKILLIPTGLAIESVAVFFVLSGYFVGGKVLRQLSVNEFRWHHYLLDRMSRLYTVLIPGIFVSYFLIKIGLKYQMENTRIDLKTLSCNLAFLMPNRCSGFAGNSSLWSLGYEFYFYLLFALFAFLITTKSSRFTRIVYICIILMIVFAATPKILVLFPAWLFGVVLWAFLRDKQNLVSRPYLLLLISLITLIVCTIYMHVLRTSDELTIFFVSIVSVPLLSALIIISDNSSILENRFIKNGNFLGNASFSVYIFHLPILKLMYAIFDIPQEKLPIMQIFGFASLSILASIVLYYPFERNTQKVRRLMYLTTKKIFVTLIHLQFLNVNVKSKHEKS